MSSRGHHPEDPEQFGEEALPRLREAVRDLSWLRTRGYGDDAARKLVGDRYRLKRRQRNAVARSACSDAQKEHRLEARRSVGSLDGDTVHVDGFNVLIATEGLLGGAYLFVGRDAAYRDVNPVQGTYRVVEQTGPAIEQIGETLAAAGAAGVVWHLDDPVSNVGRVVTRLWDTAERREWPWMVEVKADVDAALVDAGKTGGVVATSDSAILDGVPAWVNLPGAVHEREEVDANVCDLRPR
jgi:hypothetical protein